MRIRIRLAYDGSAYGGWQIQSDASRLPTIQGELEKALFHLYGETVRVTASGRTDAGVHALGQVAHFDLPVWKGDLRPILNALLPADIRILDSHIVPPSFHSRRDAVSKTYIYTFWREPAFMAPNIRSYVWNCGPLNPRPMLAILPYFLGEHDFASFQNKGSPVKSTIRRIMDIKLEELPPMEFLGPHIPPLRLTVTADGFLKQMVRNLAGFLAHVGKDKSFARDLGSILRARDRRILPSPTAPATGLALAAVNYRE